MMYGLRSTRPELHHALVVSGSYLFVIASVGLIALLIYRGAIQAAYVFGFCLLVVIAAIGFKLSVGMIRSAKLVHQLRMAEAELRQSEQRMAQAARAGKWGVWEWTVGADNIWVTDQIRTLYGFAPAEQISFNRILSVVHDDDRDMVRTGVLQLMENGGEFSRQYRVVLPGGQVRWIAAQGIVDIAADNKKKIRGVSFDISELKRSSDLLKQEKAFLKQLIDINPNLIFTKDRQGRFTLANQAVANIYGTTVDDLIGKTDADFNTSAEEVQWFHQSDTEVLDSLQKQVIPEERITDANGKTRWLETIKLPVFDSHGVVSLVLGTAIDITERKEMELDLAQQRQEQAHRSRVMMLSELSGSLTHELNQPLAAILSNAQAALRFMAQDSPDLGEVREILQDIVSDNKRASEVIQGMRLLYKKGCMQFELTDMNSVVGNTLNLLRSEMMNAGVLCKVNLTLDLPEINAARAQIQQVLINLIMNGCDAMAGIVESNRLLLITTEMDPQQGIRISVSDQGHGIPAETIDRIFEPFFTTKPQGLGLGLSVCRRIIIAHGGHLWASGNANGGTTFFFTVPVYEGSKNEQSWSKGSDS
ncbi:PAS domain-containing sensor histidine kinase [Tolumonas osonensis]|uniref:histidine kinase n=1 Tax=Tolumonas osonensis TaxID=675874 RepID=A0A841GKU8_9GAMM|nr:PAS domain-containing sensor histidine kinase [Tolumonas osonensis]MBB6055122.1 PAS domain S-box-containing protein [Tolumonas osonensis]